MELRGPSLRARVVRHQLLPASLTLVAVRTKPVSLRMSLRSARIELVSLILQPQPPGMELLGERLKAVLLGM